MKDNSKKEMPQKLAKAVMGFVNVGLLGLVLPMLWLWFVTPLCGVVLTFWGAIGLQLTAQVILPSMAIIGVERELARKQPTLTEVEVEMHSTLGRGIGLLLCWGVGALVHWLS